jgi:hypothetical protein
VIDPGPEADAYAPAREAYDRLYGDLRPSFGLLARADR